MLHAKTSEPNNTLMNLISKSRMPEYQGFLVELFASSDIPFQFHNPLHNYLYMDGIIRSKTVAAQNGQLQKLCCFTSPFIQECLYSALILETVEVGRSILALEPLDKLEDVFFILSNAIACDYGNMS